MSIVLFFACILINNAFGSSITQFQVKFFETSVIHENFFVDLLYSMPVRSQLECSKACVINYECRAYMYCYDPGTRLGQCYQYQYGEHCVAFHDEILNMDCSCHRKGRQFKDGKCYSPIGYYGPLCDQVITDCEDGRIKNINSLPIRSFIQPVNSEPFEVFCDFMYGLTLIQHRSEGGVPVDFNRTWTEYVDGFGHVHSEFWLGLEKIKLITDQMNYMLEVVLTSDSGYECGILYDFFRLNNDIPTTPYRFNGIKLSTNNRICSVKGEDIFQNNFFFSTYDKDFSGNGCAKRFGGGLWYNPVPYFSGMICNLVNLNGPTENISFRSHQVFFDVMRTTLRLQRI